MKPTAKEYALALFSSIGEKSKKDTETIIAGLAGVLAANNDMTKTEKILKEFTLLWNRSHRIVSAAVRSARPLEPDTKSAVSGYIKRVSGASTVEAEYIADSGLLGGLIVCYGDKVLDGSLKGELSELGKFLKK